MTGVRVTGPVNYNTILFRVALLLFILTLVCALVSQVIIRNKLAKQPLPVTVTKARFQNGS